jgi:hypothetical protein
MDMSKKKIFVLLFVLVLFVSYYSFAGSEPKFLKYYFSILGIRAGEANVNIERSETNIKAISTIKTYPGTKPFVYADDLVISYIDPKTLRTIKRESYSVEKDLKDTNFVFFDRGKNLVIVDSIFFGDTVIYNTNDTINDLATEIIRAMYWEKLPDEFFVNFLEVTNSRYISFSRMKGTRYRINGIKGGYIELTNIGGYYIFSKANIPVFYLFPFGDISIYVELGGVE